MNKKSLIKFLVEARKNTYTTGGGKVKAILPGSKQFEYKKGSLLYRDIFNIGNSIFAGIETIYSSGKPEWSMSYFGNFKNLKEKDVDKMLRAALIKFANKTRLWKSIVWKTKYFTYKYSGNGRGIDEIRGSEEIVKNRRAVYYFYCAGGYIG